MKTETAAYAAARGQRQQAARQFLRFTNPATYGSATEFAFSIDFASSGDIVTPTKIKRPWITSISGNTQTVEAELGRSTIGGFKVGLLDVNREMLRYFSNIALTLNGAHDSVVTTITVNQDTSGYPSIGTVEILTGGVRERVRYTGKTPFGFTGCTRGVDGTSAAAHSNGDGVSNGEQIRRGTRVQLFCGYAGIDEASYMSFAKMEVVSRSWADDRVTTILEVADIQRRPSRSTVFLTATQQAPVLLSGNPIDIALAVMLSQGTYVAQTGTIAKTVSDTAIVGTGTTFTAYTAGDVLRCSDGELLRVASVADNTHLTAAQTAITTASGLSFRKGGTNGRYDLLDTHSGVGIPGAFVDVTTWEALRTSDFSTDRYQFSLVAPMNAKTFLEEQIMKPGNSYPKINQTGQLSIVRYRVAVGAPTVTINQDAIIGYGELPADEQVINSVQFHYDFNVSGAEGIFGIFQEFLAGSPTDFTSSIGKYGRATPLVVEAMGWRTSLGGAALAATRAEQVTDRFAEPQTILILDCIFGSHNLEAGDQVFVNDARIPNIRTGQVGVSNEVFEVLDVTVSFRPYKVQLTLLWVAAIPTVAAPSDQGAAASSIPYLTFPVTEQDLDQELGTQVAAFAWYHKAVFSGSSPRTSYRAAVQEFAYTQTSGDILAYDALWEGSDAANTVGGFDLAAIERGPENAGGTATATTLVLNAGASGVDNAYTTMFVEILSNGTAGANGLIRPISTYTGGSKVIVVPSWSPTPTGTINYRIVRTGARDFGNDQNAVSAKPTTALGSGYLARWGHREIALPSAWNGKIIIGAASAMDTAPASATQVLLVRNAVIKSSAGVVVEQIARHAFSDQAVWGYGTEQNATTTKRLQMIGGSAVPTEGAMHLAAGRSTYVENASSGNGAATTGEIVVITLSNLWYIQSQKDAIHFWFLGGYSASWADSGLGPTALTWRIRRGSVSGTILFSAAGSATDGGGKVPGTNAISSGRFALNGLLSAAGVSGFENLVLTVQRDNTAHTVTMAWDILGGILTMVKSS